MLLTCNLQLKGNIYLYQVLAKTTKLAKTIKLAKLKKKRQQPEEVVGNNFLVRKNRVKSVGGKHLCKYLLPPLSSISI